jgi:hypothetical protein
MSGRGVNHIENARDEAIANPRQVTPVVVQRTTTVNQNQVIDSEHSIPATSVRSGRDRCCGVLVQSQTFMN